MTMCPDRRAFQKNSRRYFRHPGRCYHCRSFAPDFQHGFRYYRIQRILTLDPLMTLWNANGHSGGRTAFFRSSDFQSWRSHGRCHVRQQRPPGSLRPESFPDPQHQIFPCRNAHRKGYDGNGQQYPDPGFCRKQCQHVASELRLRPSLSADYQFQ